MKSNSLSNSLTRNHKYKTKAEDLSNLSGALFKWPWPMGNQNWTKAEHCITMRPALLFNSPHLHTSLREAPSRWSDSTQNQKATQILPTCWKGPLKAACAQ